MSEDRSEWNGADQFFYSLYTLKAAYHEAMSSDPPRVVSSWRILGQMYDSAAFAFSKTDRKRLEDQFNTIRARLFDEDYSKYSFIPNVAARIAQEKQAAIDELRVLQRDFFDCLHKKSMLLPFSTARRIGYGMIKEGGTH